MNRIKDLTFDERGLIPAVLQESSTGKVLMVAYMNEEALRKTLETGETWFFSRSRKKLWNKGATSGNKQKVKGIQYDCDGDTLLIQVEQRGEACHTGEESCFYRHLWREEGRGEFSILKMLYQLIQDRKNHFEEGSYTCYLFEKGLDKILKKVGEEAAEVIIASKNSRQEELINEVADLLYHVFVLLCQKNITPQEVYQELEKRYCGP